MFVVVVLPDGCGGGMAEQVDAFGDGGFIRANDRGNRTRYGFSEMFDGGGFVVGRGTARRAPTV